MARPASVALAVAVLAAVAPAGAAPNRARLDPTFGAGRGWVTTSVKGTSSVAYAALVTSDGKIVTAGQAITNSGNGQILVARYQSNGRLDPSFGSHGIFKTALPMSKGPFIATAIAAQPSAGKLLVAGGYGQGSMLVMRLTAGGRLDRGFGRRGIAVVAAGGIAQSIVVQRNGGILLGGSNANLNGRPMVVARFTPAGALDRRFGRKGLAQVLFWNVDFAASAGVTGLATTADGGVVGSAHLDYIGSDGHGSTGIFRLSSSGRPATNFGTAGHVEIAFTKSGGAFDQWFPCAMTVDGRGRITETGDGSTGTAGAILSARLTPGGALDPSFGHGGRVVMSGLGNDSDTTCGATAAAPGGLIVGVASAVAQLRPDGTPNRGFAPGGLLKIGKPRRVSINAVVRSGSRAVVLAGSAGNSAYVARYRVP